MRWPSLCTAWRRTQVGCWARPAGCMSKQLPVLVALPLEPRPRGQAPSAKTAGPARSAICSWHCRLQPAPDMWSCLPAWLITHPLLPPAFAAKEAKLLAELDAWGRGRAPTAEDVGAFPYAAACFQESLRLYPPAATAVREAKDGIQLGGLSIPGDAALQVGGGQPVSRRCAAGCAQLTSAACGQAAAPIERSKGAQRSCSLAAQCSRAAPQHGTPAPCLPACNLARCRSMPCIATRLIGLTRWPLFRRGSCRAPQRRLRWAPAAAARAGLQLELTVAAALAVPVLSTAVR